MLRLAWHHAEALVRATVRVEHHRDGHWEHAGTGFFVTDALLVTCAHVVRYDGPSRIVVASPGGVRELAVEVVRRCPDAQPVDDHYPLPDVALLRLTAAERFDGPLPRLDVAAPGDDLFAYGYTDEYRQGQVLGHSGRFLLAGGEEAEPGAGTALYRMTGDRLRTGMSGSPVLDLASGTVVGIVKRTQSEVQALGAYFVPAARLLAEIPEAAGAGPEPDPVELAGQLWANLFFAAADVLLESAGARSLLARDLRMDGSLHGDDRHQSRQLAAELFRLDLESLADLMPSLIPFLRTPDLAGALFELIATCTDFRGNPWIAADIAAELSVQVELSARTDPAQGRLLDLRTESEDLRRPYRRRGDRDSRWYEPITCLPFSHETDPDTGLPADLERDLRAGVVDRFPNSAMAQEFADPVLEPDARRRWESRERARLVSVLRGQRVIVLLPAQLALDDSLVDGLTGAYRLVFLHNSREAADDEVARHPDYQALEPGVDRAVTLDAYLRYDMTYTSLSGRR